MAKGSKTKLLWQNPEYQKHMVKVHLGQKAWNRIENWKDCLFCGTSFRSSPSLKQKFCSKSCSAKYLMKEKPGYSALHKWVYKNLGKAKVCSNNSAHKGQIEWANKSGKYKRDLKDWVSLCQKCHISYDKKHHGDFK